MSMLKSNEQNEKEINNIYSVYMHTTPSGKKYVGITKNNPRERWDCGRGYKQNPHFFNAIMKYGWINITHEILYTGLTEQEAKAKEIELISKYNLTNRKYGYNQSEGGELGCDSLKKPVYMYDKVTGEYIRSFASANEAERYLGKSGSNTIGKNCDYDNFHSNYGYLWRYEYVPKIDVKDKSKIICLFDALNLELIKEYKTSMGNFEYLGELYYKYAMTNKCNYKDYRYKNLYCCYKEDIDDLFKRYINNANTYRAVFQISIETNQIINFYYSYRDAFNKTGISDVDIGNACLGKQITAHGYKWVSVGITDHQEKSNKEQLEYILLNHTDECGITEIIKKMIQI